MDREEVKESLKIWLDHPGSKIFVEMLKSCRKDHLEVLANRYSINKENIDISYIMGQCAVLKTITNLCEDKSDEDIRDNLDNYYFINEEEV